MYSSIKKMASLFIGAMALTIGLNIALAQEADKKTAKVATSEIMFSEGKWKDIASQAKKKSGKYIFVDAYTTWCGPCKQLKSIRSKRK